MLFGIGSNTCFPVFSSGMKHQQSNNTIANVKGLPNLSKKYPFFYYDLNKGNLKIIFRDLQKG